jgi:hypothetical protein
MIQLHKQEETKVLSLCPICGERSKTMMVSDLYVEAMEGKRTNDYPGLSRAKWVNLITPPTPPKQDRLSSLHPDILAIIVLIIVGYLLVIRIFDNDPNVILLGIGIVILFLLYVFFRKRLVHRFTKNKDSRNLLLDAARKKAEIWMDLAYCSKDKVFFTSDYTVRLQPGELLGYWQEAWKIRDKLSQANPTD